MSDVTRDRPWMCLACGYTMDSCSPIEGTGSPIDGDLSLSLGCGALHTRRGERWDPMNAADWSALPPDIKAVVAKASFARQMTVGDSITCRAHGVPS
jgi:hypothetical protein